jgi:hypothetical protein
VKVKKIKFNKKLVHVKDGSLKFLNISGYTSYRPNCNDLQKECNHLTLSFFGAPYFFINYILKVVFYVNTAIVQARATY